MTKELKEKAIRLIDKAIEILGDASWTRYCLARDRSDQPVEITSPDATKFCLTGVLHKSQLELGLDEALRRETERVLNALCRFIYAKGLKKHADRQAVTDFLRFPLSYTNDALLRTQREAVELLKNAKLALAKSLEEGKEPAAAASGTGAATAAGEEVPPSPQTEEVGGMEIYQSRVEQSPQPPQQAEAEDRFASGIELPELDLDIMLDSEHDVSWQDSPEKEDDG